MKNADVLEKAITGEPVTVEIRGSVHRLSYPIHNLIVYQQKTSDSLFDREAWKRIDLQQNPDRWFACLWAGLHELQPDGTWKVPYSYEQLGALVDFANAAEISVKMVKALIAHFPAPEKPSPKAQPDPSDPDSPRSSNSGPDAEVATASLASNS